jgi:NarL family two-component system response regulator YdfI
MIRIVLADDHLVVRTGLRFMVATTDDVEIVGEAADGAAAVSLVERVQPDVVLMDLRMPTMDGLEAIRQIRAQWPHVAVVILTTYDEDSLMIQGLQASASGYLLKDCTLETLLHAVRAAARGETIVPPDVLQRILGHAARSTAAPGRSSDHRPLDLTDRECEVLEGVARGERSKEIARRLSIADRTVGSYLNSIYAKLGVDSRASAVAVAMERGLLPRR